MSQPKRVIIVGASSGIGEALARLFVVKQCLIGVTGRRTVLLNAFQGQYPHAVLSKTLDVTETATVAPVLDQLVQELGGLDLLVISSGTGDLNPQLDFVIEQRTIQTNVAGFTAVADWAFNFFEKKGSGHLVGITSVGGLRGNRQGPSYSASKAYQINYLEGMRQRARHSQADITVTDIRPGFVNTAMAKGEGLFWVAPVEEAAQQIIQAIDRKKQVAYITRRWGIVAAVFKRIPGWLYERM